MGRKEVEEQAIKLAKDNKKSEPQIKKIFWFPNDDEVRLVEIEDDFVISGSKIVEPFYFDASPKDDLPLPSGVAIIRSDEFKKISLPDDWGSWDDAQELEID
ncbi:hypothetical protein IIC38_11855 [candidate division KSB1 bacterium]|nr:hypothetical protein [candidate division KSB1 bacterium]